MNAILDVQTPNKYSEKIVSKSISYDELLFGTKNMNDGNYVLLVGSNMFDSCCSFFGEYDFKERTIEDWYISNSAFLSVIDETKKSDSTYEIINFGLFNIIYSFNGKFYDNKNHEILFSREMVCQLLV